VRVDGAVEGDGRASVDFVDDRAGAHVEELEAAKLAGADLALGHVEQRLLRRLLVAVDLPAKVPWRHRPRAYRTGVRSRKGATMRAWRGCPTTRSAPGWRSCRAGSAGTTRSRRRTSWRRSRTPSPS